MSGAAARGLQAEAEGLLAELIRFNTVNPPGNERPVIEHLDRYLSAAGFATETLAKDPARPNLVAQLTGLAAGPVLGLLGHVDTVPADPSEWRHDPWSGVVADGFLWGRGAIDMKSQVAAEAVAAVSLARAGWRPRHGTLKLIFVADEEIGGDVGAQWLCREHPDQARCDMLINEGGGAVFSYRGRRFYGVGCGEKGVCCFDLEAKGTAAHASIPRAGDNALLKLAPVLAAFADQPREYVTGDTGAALLSALGLDALDPARSLAAIAAGDPALYALLEPMFCVTLNPTLVGAG